MRGLTVGVALGAAFCFAAPSGSQESRSNPRELYESLNALRVNPAAVYRVKQIEVLRGDVRMSLEEGTLALFEPLNSRITGAVFTGQGHILAVPRDAAEKQQLARFLGVPMLDEGFRTAYLRFTDNTAEELQQQLAAAKFEPQPDPGYAAQWNDILAQRNPVQTLRILVDLLSDNEKPFFAATLDGVSSGAFDFVWDPRRDEPVLLGQTRVIDGAFYYNVWASYRPGGAPETHEAFRAVRYAIETTILPDRSLEGNTEVTLRATQDGERLLTVELSRLLGVESVTESGGAALPYFQNEGLNLRERLARGNDSLYVVLPKPARRGEEITLRLRYRGTVIADAGNGVIFVGSRGSWYPHVSGPDSFADYLLTLRWPRKLRLAATGTKLDEREEGDFRVGHWRTEKPIPVAGFNLGEYASAGINESNCAVEVFANRDLEQALKNRLATPLDIVPGASVSAEGALPRVAGRERLELPMPVPSPADAMKQLAREVSSSIRFYETYSGAFPFRKLSVSQIPGTFGQGWPGLLYISTYSFLPSEAQSRMGLTTAGQAHFSELVPFHEVAHQWWGNVVGWTSYRDQWIDEALANYFALLFADSQKNPDRAMRDWLMRYRARLLERRPGEDLAPSDIGPLTMGYRLTASKSPNGFEEVVYAKGAWVMHMLRMMLRQPGSRNPDARFIALLHTLISKYAYRGLSTEELQREVEAEMTPAMDVEGGHSMEWFFDEWVRGTGVPHYKAEYSVKRAENGFVVRGKLRQRGVPRGFVAPVPLYANLGGGQMVSLGTVIASGKATSFRFVTPSAPHKVVIDPQMTLLCVVE